MVPILVFLGCSFAAPPPPILSVFPQRLAPAAPTQPHIHIYCLSLHFCYVTWSVDGPFKGETELPFPYFFRVPVQCPRSHCSLILPFWPTSGLVFRGPYTFCWVNGSATQRGRQRHVVDHDSLLLANSEYSILATDKHTSKTYARTLVPDASLCNTCVVSNVNSQICYK